MLAINESFYINEDKYNKVTDYLSKIYNLKAIDPKATNIRSIFEIYTPKGKILFTYYKNGNMFIQGNRTIYYSDIERYLKEELFLIQTERINLSIQTEEQNAHHFYIGCDESGAGESFGSLFLGCSLIKSENIKQINNLLGKKKISRLNFIQLRELTNSLKNYFEYTLYEYTASEIDAKSKIDLLDQGYIELISKTITKTTRPLIVIDNYGIGKNLSEYIKAEEKNGIKFEVKYRADESSVACKIASVVARSARLGNIESINNKYFLLDPKTGNKILPGSGSPSNVITLEYLKSYRNQHPYSELPSFVRRKWGNIQSFMDQYPIQIDSFVFLCPHCNLQLNLIFMKINDNNESRIYCSRCDNLISAPYFRKNFRNRKIAIDTSAIISRSITKDLQSTKYLEGNEFLLPTYVYEELDSKNPNLKKGGQSEIVVLQQKKKEDLINLTIVDTHMLAHGLINDKKILSVLNNNKSALITKDRNMETFASIDHFVIRID